MSIITPFIVVLRLMFILYIFLFYNFFILIHDKLELINTILLINYLVIHKFYKKQVSSSKCNSNRPSCGCDIQGDKMWL